MKKRLLKILFVFALLWLGFSARQAFAFTCTVAAGGGNWSSAATWGGCNSTVPQTGDDVVFDGTSGSVVVDTLSGLIKSMVMTGYTATMSGASNLQVGGATASTQNVTFAGTITWTGALRLNPATSSSNINLTTNGKLLTSIEMLTGSAVATTTLMDNLSFSAAKGDAISLAGTKLDMNGKTISGNSTINRVILQSNAVGTARTVFVNGGTFANADFKDITLTTSTDLSNITGKSGDCGGNTNITFTAATSTASTGTASFSWSTHAWTVRVPLPQDDVTVSNAMVSAQAITIDMPRAGHSLDFSGLTWSGTAPTVQASGVSPMVSGSLKLKASLGSSLAGTWVFEGRSGTSLANGTSTSMPANGWQITTAGLTLTNTFNFAAFGGTYQLQDALNTSGTFTFSNGTFDANGFNVTAAGMSSANANVRTLNMTTSTWTFTSTANVWNFSGATNATVNATSSTLSITNTTATAKSVFGNAYTYGTVIYAGDNITQSGNNTIANLKLNNPNYTNGVKFTGTSTTTITTSFSTTATSTAGLAVATSTAATIAELKYTGAGNICTDFLNIARILGTPSSIWYVGANSTNSGNNSGLTFTACPAAAASGANEILRFE